MQFIRTQLDIAPGAEELHNLEKWMHLTKNLTTNNKFKFTPKINVTFPIPIRKLYKNFEEYKEKFKDSVIEIWQNTDKWNMIYISNEYKEI